MVVAAFTAWLDVINGKVTLSTPPPDLTLGGTHNATVGAASLVPPQNVLAQGLIKVPTQIVRKDLRNWSRKVPVHIFLLPIVARFKKVYDLMCPDIKLDNNLFHNHRIVIGDSSPDQTEKLINLGVHRKTP